MNDLIELIKTRQSIRKFQKDPLPEEDIQEIVEASLRSPSAGNKQPWRIVRVQEQTRKNALAKAAFGQSFMADAPVVLVVCAVPEESAERYGKRGKSLYVLQDTAALTTTILFAAHSHGYGTCWIGAFDEGEVSRILNIPSGTRAVAMIPIGKTKGERPPFRPRKPSAEIIIEEEF